MNSLNNYIKNEWIKYKSGKNYFMIIIGLVLLSLSIFSGSAQLIKEAGVLDIYFAYEMQIFMVYTILNIISIGVMVNIEFQNGIILNNHLSGMDINRLIFSKNIVIFVINIFMSLVLALVFCAAAIYYNLQLNVGDVLKLLIVFISLVIMTGINSYFIIVIGIFTKGNFAAFLGGTFLFVGSIYLIRLLPLSNATLDFVLGYLHPMGQSFDIQRYIINLFIPFEISMKTLSNNNIIVTYLICVAYIVILIKITTKNFVSKIIYSIK